MPKFRDMTIRKKLISLIMLVTMSAILVTGAALLGFVHRSFKQSVVEEITTDASMTSENCNIALAFHNSRDIDRTLSSFKSKADIVFAGVYTLSGETFGEYFRKDVDEAVKPPYIKDDGHYFEGMYLTTYQGIMLEDERIGTLCIKADLKNLYSILRRNIFALVTVSVCAMLFAYILSSRLEHLISGPILSLAKITRAISSKKDFSMRAQRMQDDEVGELIDSFNDMLEQLQKRDAKLISINQQLRLEVVEREKAKRELAKANVQLEATIKQLMMANKELKDFARIAAHDLKSPLRAVATLAEWLAEDYSDKFDKKGVEQTKMLINRVTRMNNHIDSILKYAEIGRLRERPALTDLNKLVTDISRFMDIPSNIEVTIENPLPEIRCERGLIQQVFENLIGNSIKYMDKPEGQIRIGCMREDLFYKFYVADNGPGIDEKYFEKIFQIFQTLKRRDDFESTGIGLSIVKKIVDLQGGKVWVESEVNVGSTFYFTWSVKGSEVPENEEIDTYTIG